MAVERFKHDGEWKVIGSSSGKVQVSDDKLDSESINSIQNKVVTKALEYKADIVNKFVNAYGIRSVSNTEYCMPDIDAGNPAHTLATKADIISNEALESKATMYNLYAMDDLTAEQLAANETAFEAVRNGEVALYRVYTNDTTYASADVKIVPGPYLEAYVYVNTPNADSKQATIIKYTYTFDQSGEYTTSDKEEVTLPSIDKVNELIGSGVTGGGLELRELKMSGSVEDNAYNLETLELMRENKVLPAMPVTEDTLTPLTYIGNNQFILQIVEMGIEINMSFTMGEDGSITMSQDVIAPYVLNSPSKVLKWLDKSRILAQLGMYEPAHVIYNGLLCLVDCIEAGGTGSTRSVVQFNYDNQRFERIYNATTGEEISTTEIPIGSGGGTDEVYIGSDTPPKGTKVWIDPSGEGGGSQPSEGGINVFIFPEEVGSSDYTSDNPYVFSAEKSAELLAALKKKDTIYLIAMVTDASSPVEQTQSMVANMLYVPQMNIFQSQNILYQSGFLSIITIQLKVNSDGIVSGYNENVTKKL